jgi:hypothetical protein
VQQKINFKDIVAPFKIVQETQYIPRWGLTKQYACNERLPTYKGHKGDPRSGPPKQYACHEGLPTYKNRQKSPEVKKCIKENLENNAGLDPTRANSNGAETPLASQ